MAVKSRLRRLLVLLEQVLISARQPFGRIITLLPPPHLFDHRRNLSRGVGARASCDLGAGLLERAPLLLGQGVAYGRSCERSDDRIERLEFSPDNRTRLLAHVFIVLEARAAMLPRSRSSRAPPELVGRQEPVVNAPLRCFANEHRDATLKLAPKFVLRDLTSEGSQRGTEGRQDVGECAVEFFGDVAT